MELLDYYNAILFISLVTFFFFGELLDDCTVAQLAGIRKDTVTWVFLEESYIQFLT